MVLAASIAGRVGRAADASSRVLALAAVLAPNAVRVADMALIDSGHGNCRTHIVRGSGARRRPSERRGRGCTAETPAAGDHTPRTARRVASRHTACCATWVRLRTRQAGPAGNRWHAHPSAQRIMASGSHNSKPVLRGVIVGWRNAAVSPTGLTAGCRRPESSRKPASRPLAQTSSWHTYPVLYAPLGIAACPAAAGAASTAGATKPPAPCAGASAGAPAPVSLPGSLSSSRSRFLVPLGATPACTTRKPPGPNLRSRTGSISFSQQARIPGRALSPSTCAG